MDDYPSSYTARPRPLILLSGFDVRTPEAAPAALFQNGPRISSDSRLITKDRILQEFLAFDPSERPDPPVVADAKLMHFRIKAAGRQYILPCRKSSPAPRSPGSPLAAPTLHSALSPLSQGSTLYPDGVMHEFWPLKWQEAIPSVFISFFPLDSDSSNDSLNDNRLKSEINALKAALNDHYHIRYAVVLVNEMSKPQGTDIEDRLANIRKATKLDVRSSFFYLPPNLSPEDLAAFASSVLSAVRPMSQDFYRDLTKHTRRKRDKGVIPVPTNILENGISRAISKSGWVARYEYKMGVFAEFRFELQAAKSHFDAALESLFNTDGVLEHLSDWSPRFKEVRLFADSIAIRQIRCLLANGQPTTASRFWVRYRDITQYLLERRSKGSACYGWKAWEARWAKIMAELVKGSMFIAVDSTARKVLDGVLSNKGQVYAEIDRDQFTDEQHLPWELLHHPGYWFVYSADQTRSRRILAHEMPEEDRIPPGQSPATRVARRQETYDTYLCPEPHMEYPISGSEGFDYCEEIVGTLQDAIAEFARRSQVRMADGLRLRIAKELSGASRFEEAMSILKPLWHRHAWRRTKWWEVAGEIASDLYQNALETRDIIMQVSALWELMSTRFQPQQGQVFDLMGLMVGASLKSSDADSVQSLHLRHEEIESFLNVEFSFGSAETHAGETIRAQIILSSSAQPNSLPISLTSLQIEFEGELRSIRLDHGPSSDHDSSFQKGGTLISAVRLSESDGSFTNEDMKRGVVFYGVADLTLAPNQIRIFEITMSIREAGDVKALAAQASIQTDSIHIRLSKNLQHETSMAQWWVPTLKSPRKTLGFRSPVSISVHPKLPKVNMEFPSLRNHYYTDECINIETEVTNGEAEGIEINLEVRVPGHENRILSIKRIDEEEPSDALSSRGAALTYRLGRIESLAMKKLSIALRAPSVASDLALEVKTVYCLISEADTPLSKTSSTTMKIKTPFDANYIISPDLHPYSWPSFFHVKDTQEAGEPLQEVTESVSSIATGIFNRWALETSIVSVATEEILLESVELEILNVSDGAICTLFDSPCHQNGVLIAGSQRYEYTFKLDTRRLLLEDTRTTGVEIALRVHWRRADTANANMVTTIIAAPRLAFPTSEPRVLASRGPPTKADSICIELTIENPSMHFLSFNISMEPDDDFAFSGAKLAVKHLLPMSRQTLHYSLLPFIRGGIIRPIIKVVDIHFDKSLHVHPTGDLKADDNGLLLSVG